MRHQKSIKIRPGLILDPHPGTMQLPQFLFFDAILRELQAVLGNALSMAHLRALLPPGSGANLDDHHVLHQVAQMVTQGTAALKTVKHGGDVLWDDVIANLQRFEGNVPHMYRDNAAKGNVTVGIGQMLPNSAAAAALPFVVRATGQPATPAEKIADYDLVMSQPAAQSWRSYKSNLDLPQATINSYALAIAKKCEVDVRSSCKSYDKYPIEVKEVLIDICYNVGSVDGFPSLLSNIELAQTTGLGKYWQAAALQTHRKGIQPDRNQWAHDMILKGGGITK